MREQERFKNREAQTQEDAAQAHELNDDGTRKDGRAGLPAFDPSLTDAQRERQEQARELIDGSHLDTFANITRPVQVGWECRSCLDFFTKPKFRWDDDYQQNAAACPHCNQFL